MGWVQVIFILLRAVVRSQAELAAENLALRQQLAVLEQGAQRPRLRSRDPGNPVGPRSMPRSAS
jgi:hypothetical protein